MITSIYRHRVAGSFWNMENACLILSHYYRGASEQLRSGQAVSDPNYSVASAEKIQRPGQNKQRSPAFQHCWLEVTDGDHAHGKRQEKRKGGRDMKEEILMCNSHFRTFPSYFLCDLSTLTSRHCMEYGNFCSKMYIFLVILCFPQSHKRVKTCPEKKEH